MDAAEQTSGSASFGNNGLDFLYSFCYTLTTTKNSAHFAIRPCSQRQSCQYLAADNHGDRRQRVCEIPEVLIRFTTPLEQDPNRNFFVRALDLLKIW